jgi:hypothetical protein
VRFFNLEQNDENIGFRFSADVLEKIRQPKHAATSHLISSPLEYWRYVSPTTKNDYGLCHFAYWLVAKLKKNRELMADQAVCALLSECRRVLRATVTLLDEVERDCQTAGYPEGLSKLDFALIKQSALQVLWIIPIDKVNQVLNSTKKTKEEVDEGFFDYQQRTNDSEDSVASEEENAHASIACKNSNVKGEYRSKVELDHLVAIARHYMATYRVTFEQLVDVVALNRIKNFNSELKKCFNLDENDLTLDNLLSHLRKTDLLQYPKKDEDPEDPTSSTKSEFLKDMALLEKELCTYKLRETTINLTPVLMKNFEKAWLSKPKTIKYFEQTKVATKVAEQHIQMVQHYRKLFFEKIKAASLYSSWVLCFKERVLMYEQREEIVEFIKLLAMTFIHSERKADLLKLLNVILEKSFPDQVENEDSSSLKAFRWLQHLLKDSEVTSVCLSVLTQHSDPDEISHACQLLSNLLTFGNHSVQVNVYNTLFHGHFTKDFFQYLKFQFAASLQTTAKHEGFVDQPTAVLGEAQSRGVSRLSMQDYCRVMTGVLLMLKLLCDNCYLDFQNFFRIQITAGVKDNPSSVDMVTSIAEFLITTNKLYESSRQEDLMDLIKAVVNTLTEFVLGPCRENQRILIENKKVIETVNSVINTELNLCHSEFINDSLYKKVEILSECAIFIESLIVGNEDLKGLDKLLETLSKEGLVNRLVEIYIWKVKGKKSELILDQFCHKVAEDDEGSEDPADGAQRSDGKPGCTSYLCLEGYRTKLDKILVETGFKIFLIMQQLEDKIGANLGIDRFRYQPVPLLHRIPGIEEALFGQSRRSAHNINSLVRKHSLIKEVGPSLTGDLPGNTDKKKVGTKQFRADKLNQISSGQAKQKQRAGPPNFDSLTLAPNQKNSDMMVPEESTIQPEDDHFPDYLDTYKKSAFNEARQFFMSYVASVEVLHKEELVKVHFTIPYFCKYITQRIEESIIWEIDRNSDQERLEMFLSKVDKYEYQMKRRQAMSSRRWLFFFIDNWKIIRLLAYLLVVLINLLLLVSLIHAYSVAPSADNHQIYTLTTINNNFDSVLKDGFGTPFIVLEILQLLFCLANFALVLYEASPVIVFNSYLKKQIEDFKKGQQIKIGGISKSGAEREEFDPDKITMVKKAWLIIRNYTNLYNLVLIVISAISLSGYRLLYSVLLLDIVNHSRNLSRTVVSFIKNYRIILLSGITLVLLVYFLSIIGFEYFPYIFNRVS